MSGLPQTIRPSERSVGALLRLAADYLSRRGSPSGRLDAEVLLAHVLGRDRVYLYVHYDQPLEPAEVDRFRELVRRRGRGEPVAYLVGQREFCSLPLAVTPAVLIPRPETELLVEAVAEQIGLRSVRIADVGTGSGAIAIALARRCPHCRIIAIDCSPAALAVARANAERHGVSAQIEFREGDLLEPAATEVPLDAIVSNPPYVPTAEWERLDASVRDYEPRFALDGGPDGLDVIRRLVRAAPARLVAGGLLALEVGAGQREAVEALLQETGFQRFRWVHDYAGIPRVVLARWRSSERSGYGDAPGAFDAHR